MSLRSILVTAGRSLKGTATLAPTVAVTPVSTATTTPALTEITSEGVKARIKAIIDLDEAKGREKQAERIALHTDASIDQAKAILTAAPQEIDHIPSIAERMASVNDFLSGGLPASRPDGGAELWDRAIAKVNETTAQPTQSVQSRMEAQGDPGGGGNAAEGGSRVNGDSHDGTTPTSPPSPAFLHIDDMSNFDHLAILPKKAKERVLLISERREEIQAVYQKLSAEWWKEHDALKLQQDNLRCLTDRDLAYRHGTLYVTEDDPSYVSAKDKVEKAATKFERLDARKRSIEGRQQSILRVHENVERFVRQLNAENAKVAMRNCAIKPKEGETAENAIGALREKIATREADRHELQSKPYTVAEAIKIATAQISKLAERGRPNAYQLIDHLNMTWPTQHGLGDDYRGSRPHFEYPDALGVLAWLHKDALLAAIERDIRAAGDDENAISEADRIARDAALSAEILDLEYTECAAIWQNGDIDLLRPDCSPEAILGIDVKGAAPLKMNPN